MDTSTNGILSFIGGAGLIGISWYTSYLIHGLRHNRYASRGRRTASI